MLAPEVGPGANLRPTQRRNSVVPRQDHAHAHHTGCHATAAAVAAASCCLSRRSLVRIHHRRGVIPAQVNK